MLKKPHKNKIIFITSNINETISYTENNSNEEQIINVENSSRFIVGERYKISMIDNKIKKWKRLNNYSIVVEDDFRDLFTNKKKFYSLMLLVYPIFPYFIFHIFTKIMTDSVAIGLSPIFFLLVIIVSITCNFKYLMYYADQSDKLQVTTLNFFEKLYSPALLLVSVAISACSLYIIYVMVQLLVGSNIDTDILVNFAINLPEKVLLAQIIPFVILLALEFYYYDKAFSIYNEINNEMDEFMN